MVNFVDTTCLWRKALSFWNELIKKCWRNSDSILIDWPMSLSVCKSSFELTSKYPSKIWNLNEKTQNEQKSLILAVPLVVIGLRQNHTGKFQFFYSHIKFTYNIHENRSNDWNQQCQQINPTCFLIFLYFNIFCVTLANQWEKKRFFSINFVSQLNLNWSICRSLFFVERAREFTERINCFKLNSKSRKLDWQIILRFVLVVTLKFR